MKNKKSGWFNEPGRHSLSARGIETTAKGRWRKEYQEKIGYKEDIDEVALCRYTFTDTFDLEDLIDLNSGTLKSIQKGGSRTDILSTFGQPYIEVKRVYDDGQEKDYYTVELTLPPPFSGKPDRARVFYIDYDTSYYNMIDKLRDVKKDLDEISFDEYTDFWDEFPEHGTKVNYRTLLEQRLDKDE